MNVGIFENLSNWLTTNHQPLLQTLRDISLKKTPVPTRPLNPYFMRLGAYALTLKSEVRPGAKKLRSKVRTEILPNLMKLKNELKPEAEEAWNRLCNETIYSNSALRRVSSYTAMIIFIQTLIATSYYISFDKLEEARAQEINAKFEALKTRRFPPL
jgi:hypothetical protein